MGRTVSELMSQNISNTIINAQTWNGLLYAAKAYALKGDGTTDDYTTLNALINTTINGDGATIAIYNGDYRIGTSITIPSNVNLMFFNGGTLKPDSGKTITINGNILAGNYEIFIDNGGIIDLDNSPNEYNLSWFLSGSGYINERWNFAKRAMATFRTKIIRIPRPYEGQAGVLKSTNRLYWYFSDEIKIMDNQNASTWYIDGEFYAKNNCTNFLNFDDVAKPENIYFYGALQALVPAGTVVNYGINVKSIARLTFYGNVVLGGFQTPVKIGGADQVAAVTDVRFLELQASFFTNTAVNIYGKAATTVQNIIIDNLQATAAQTTGLNAVEVRGLLRDIKINNTFYATDVAKDGYTANDVDNVVYIESNAEGTILHCEIGAVYQANANNGVKVTSAVSDITKIGGLVIRRVHGKFNGSAIDLDYCQGVSLYDIENTSTITLGTNAFYTKIITGNATKTITDNGSYTTINGLGKQSRGAGVLPAANIDWSIGNYIRESADGKIYLRYAKTGVAATDFVKVSPGGFGIATILAAGTSIVVTHGMGYAPTNVTAMAKGNVGNMWATSIGSTTFTINCSSAPGSNTDVSWRAD